MLLVGFYSTVHIIEMCTGILGSLSVQEQPVCKCVFSVLEDGSFSAQWSSHTPAVQDTEVAVPANPVVTRISVSGFALKILVSEFKRNYDSINMMT